MKLLRVLLAGIFLMASGAVRAHGQQAASGPPAAVAEELPKDINPITRNRLSPVKPEELDEHGRQLIAKIVAQGRPITSAGGPTSIRANSPDVLEPMDALNNYLRRNAGIEPPLVELAILVAARAMDSPYVWNDHEKLTLKAGLSKESIDIVKFRKPLAGMNEAEATLVQLGREAFYDHKVDSVTFARALKIFGQQKLVNIVSLMTDYASSALLLATFDQHLPAGQASMLPMP